MLRKRLHATLSKHYIRPASPKDVALRHLNAQIHLDNVAGDRFASTSFPALPPLAGDPEKKQARRDKGSPIAADWSIVPLWPATRSALSAHVLHSRS